MKSSYDEVNAALGKIVKSWAQPQNLQDASVVIRIMGEFSSGKTRFVSELFASLIPPDLKPVSSLETQTFLPLEITYGEAASLELIERREDQDEAKVLKKLFIFPRRGELRAYDQANCRLRLFLPEPLLTLETGDGVYEDSHGPQRLRIIDQPGWNSGDEKNGWEALGLSTEWLNLALVYVCKANRLDSAVNHQALASFIEGLKNRMERARETLPLFFVITDCPATERDSAIKRHGERVLELLGSDADSFPLSVQAVDFKTMGAGEKKMLASRFWDHVLADSPSRPMQAGSLQKMMAKWPAAWHMRPYLEKCQHFLEELSALAAKIRPDGKYMGGRQMSFFDGLKYHELSSRIMAEFMRRNGSICESGLEKLTPPDLPSDHPLRPWLDAYWLPRLREPVLALQNFCVAAKKAINAINPAIRDLEAYLAERLDSPCNAARNSLPLSFQALVRLCRGMNNVPEHTLLATLLAASLLEARYADSAANCQLV